MMKIYVDDGNFLSTLIKKPLGYDGSVVQETIPSEKIFTCMMTGWSAQRQASCISVRNDFLCLLSCHTGSLGSFPSSCVDRSVISRAVKTSLAIDMLWTPLLHPSNREVSRHQIAVETSS